MHIVTFATNQIIPVLVFQQNSHQCSSLIIVHLCFTLQIAINVNVFQGIPYQLWSIMILKSTNGIWLHQCQ